MSLKSITLKESSAMELVAMRTLTIALLALTFSLAHPDTIVPEERFEEEEQVHV